MTKATFPALKATNRLPSPPAVAMRILQLVASNNTTIDELARVISADPALTAKILKYLHSPLIGLGFHGSTLSEAVARIGTRGAQLLALSFSLISQKQHQCCPSFDFNLFWSKSLARAVAVKRLVAAGGRGNPEEAFITGLVFRIGQLVLATALPAEYEPVLRTSLGKGGDLVTLERAALGTDHFEIGCQLLQDWKLPPAIAGAIAPFAIFPQPAADRIEAKSLNALLRLADTIADFLVENREQQARLKAGVIAQAEELAGLDRGAFGLLFEQIGQDWAAYGDLLSISTAEPPDLDTLEHEADDHRTTLRLAAELEVVNLRSENQQLSHLANRDRLTGLLNRGAFDDMLGTAVSAAAAKRSFLALLMVDLDQFKLVNDRHGHPVGDAVLRHFARIFHAYAKSPVEAFRYGGEEFAVLIPATSQIDVLSFAETLREAVAHSPLLEGSKTIPITISIGVAWARWPDRALTPAMLVQTADEWLYKAKQTGRNTCCHAPLDSAASQNPR